MCYPRHKEHVPHAIETFPTTYICPRQHIIYPKWEYSVGNILYVVGYNPLCRVGATWGTYVVGNIFYVVGHTSWVTPNTPWVYVVGNISIFNTPWVTYVVGNMFPTT